LELLLDRPSLGGRTDLMPLRHIPRSENRIHPAVWDWVPCDLELVRNIRRSPLANFAHLIYLVLARLDGAIGS
jgi:hypothetical protein